MTRTGWHGGSPGGGPGVRGEADAHLHRSLTAARPEASPLDLRLRVVVAVCRSWRPRWSLPRASIRVHGRLGRHRDLRGPGRPERMGDGSSTGRQGRHRDRRVEGHRQGHRQGVRRIGRQRPHHGPQARRARGDRQGARSQRLVAGRATPGRPEDGQAVIDACIERYGTCDILVNNAATNPHAGPLIDVPLSMWDKTHEVNLRGPLAWTQLAWETWMRDNGGGDHQHRLGRRVQDVEQARRLRRAARRASST